MVPEASSVPEGWRRNTSRQWLCRGREARSCTSGLTPIVHRLCRLRRMSMLIGSQTVNILAQLDLLATCSLPLARACKSSLMRIDDWFRLIDKKQRPSLDEVTSQLQSALDDYHVQRLETVKPFRHMFDPAHLAPEEPDPRYVCLYETLLTIDTPTSHLSELCRTIPLDRVFRSASQALSQVGRAAHCTIKKAAVAPKSSIVVSPFSRLAREQACDRGGRRSRG